MHGCPCVEGDCLLDLVCLPDLDICAEPGGTETGDGTSTSDGTSSSDGTDTGTDESGSSETTGGGGCKHRVFVTTQVYMPASHFTTQVEADDICEAEAVGLQGTFKAVLSGPMAANARLELCGDVYLANDGSEPIDNTLVAAQEDWWSGDHLQPIRRTAGGIEVGSSTTVWTGSKVDGLPSTHTCQNWLDGSGESVGTIGNATDVGGGWISVGSDVCDVGRAFYCLEQFD